MKRTLTRCLPVFLILSMAHVAYAQLEVGCKARAASFLQFEPVEIILEIKNNTSRDVVVGGERADAFLHCDIHDSRGVKVARTKTDVSSFLLPAREVFRKKVNVLPYYDLRNNGSYTLRMRIDWLNKYFSSENCYFDIFRGSKLASMVTENQEDGTFRTLTLETMVRDRVEQVFLRVEDDASCYGVVKLGKIIKLYKPTMIADFSGNVHILFQSGPVKFTKVVVTANGVMLERKSFATEEGMPEMEMDGSGDVVVMQEFEDE